METSVPRRQLASIEQDTASMRDGVPLAVDVYRPPDGRVPAILLRTPYDRRNLQDRIGEIDPLLVVNEQFALVMQDVRGRGDSGGVFEPLVSDMEDGADTVAWIRRQPWSDGRVTMAGASYDAGVQFQAARTKPEGLVAIAPTAGGSVRDVLYPGGALRLTALDGWLARLLLEAQDGDLDAAARTEIEALLGVTALERFHAFIEPGTVAWQICAPLRPWVLDPLSDPYWTHTIAMPDDPIAAMHTTGFYDSCLGAAMEAYSAWSAVADPASPQLLTLGPWDHGLGAAYPQLGLDEIHSPPGRVALKRQLEFLNAMLGRAPIEDLVPVMSFVLGRNSWHEDTQWPPADVRSLELRLTADADGNGRLSRAESDEPRTLRYCYDPRDPVPTLGGAHSVVGLVGPLEKTAIEARADVGTFTSARFDAELEVAGSPIARLAVASSAPATDFIARLTLVDPDGRSFPVAHGIWSGFLGELPTAHAASAHRCCEIALGPIHIAVAPGARLRLQVTSSCYPELYPNPNTGHDLKLGPPPRVQTAEQSLLLVASSLALPVRGRPPRESAP
jgi:putative CocE/NonD family hydrolase